MGDEFQHKLRMNTTITQTLFVYPDFSDVHDRANTNLNTVTKLSKWLGWQNTFADVYVSEPRLGKKRNDLLFSTGVNIALAH